MLGLLTKVSLGMTRIGGARVMCDSDVYDSILISRNEKKLNECGNYSVRTGTAGMA